MNLHRVGMHLGMLAIKIEMEPNQCLHLRISVGCFHVCMFLPICVYLKLMNIYSFEREHDYTRYWVH